MGVVVTRLFLAEVIVTLAVPPPVYCGACMLNCLQISWLPHEEQNIVIGFSDLQVLGMWSSARLARWCECVKPKSHAPPRSPFANGEGHHAGCLRHLHAGPLRLQDMLHACKGCLDMKPKHSLMSTQRLTDDGTKQDNVMHVLRVIPVLSCRCVLLSWSQWSVAPIFNNHACVLYKSCSASYLALPVPWGSCESD
eukprot:5291078-Amphidinium_carterae.1